MTEKQRWVDAYLNAMALFCILREPSILRIRRAELRQGEVKAEAIDYMIDIELKADKALSDPFSTDSWENILDDPESYPSLPEPIQVILGKAFLEGQLGAEGHYKSLYFKARNDQARKYVLPEE